MAGQGGSKQPLCGPNQSLVMSRRSRQSLDNSRRGYGLSRRVKAVKAVNAVSWQVKAGQSGPLETLGCSLAGLGGHYANSKHV